ncbi:628_t:CDS:2 [Funneliformis mosseae]|uniref:628_t:CDS:1 n=1 Tax=Funneliformis mosseae TaxID=27381 RepID=A0A9N8ZRM5_FUNMO|nr:628_t:CDS:2 [Funneliformis mosseae]
MDSILLNFTSLCKYFTKISLSQLPEVKYYNDTYDWNFVSIAELALSDLSSSNSHQLIVVLSIANQFGHIRIANEIFGSNSASRYQKVHIYTGQIYPGHVQFYFEHTIQLPIGTKTPNEKK